MTLLRSTDWMSRIEVILGRGFMSPYTDIDVHHFQRLQFLAVVDFDLLKYKGFNLHRGT